MVSEQLFYAFSWASWSGIIAGAVTAGAISVLMAILGVALGFTVIDPKSDEPAHNLGKAFGAWGFVSILVAMAAGGFIAGLFSGRQGMEHGFLVWAVVLLIATLCSTMAIGTALRGITSAVGSIGSALRSMGSGAADMASNMGDSAKDMASGAMQQLKEKMDLNLDTERLNQSIRETLRDTGINEVQPEYLKGQLREARMDLRAALRQLSMRPGEAETIINRFLDKEKSRVEALTSSINRDDAVKAVMNTRNVPQAEAETMVDNALAAYDDMVVKAKDTLADFRDHVDEAREYIRERADDAREKADSMASIAAKTALAAAMALVIAAVISMGAGYCGAKYGKTLYSVKSTYIVR